jgi:hypothetical protein
MTEVQAPNIKLADQDNTTTQGFEPASRNIIPIDPGDCPHCLKPFLGRGAGGNRINVYTSYGKDQWCQDCVESVEKKNICVRESRLTKEEKKLWEKRIKKGM